MITFLPMKKFLPLIVLLLFSIVCSGQQIVEPRQGSFYTFIYKVTNQQAFNLYFKDGQPDSLHFTTLVKTFPTDSAFNEKLPAGHYLFVKTKDNKLLMELESINNLSMKILDNERDLMLVFTDAKNQEVKNLAPKLKGRRVPFNQNTQAFTIRKTNYQGRVIVEYNGHENFFSINRRYNNTTLQRTKRRILGTFPINHIVSPVRYLSSSIKYRHFYRPGIVNKLIRLFEDKTFEGFMVTNKPKYKPGDTLKLKAYVRRRNGQPISKKLYLYLGGYGGGHSLKKIKTLLPYRKGFYEGEIILHDSLQLELDDRYYVTLEDKNFRNNYPAENFYFEEYELKQNTFFANEHPKNKLGKPATLVLKGMDSNDLPLFDVQSDILLRRKLVRDFYEESLFIPDTLWHHKMKLETFGDIEVKLPDSAFYNAHYEYEAIITFTNAENEYHQKRLTLNYDAHAIDVTLQLQNDSLKITGSVSTPLHLVGYNQEHEVLFKKEIALPHQEKINAEEFSYHVYRDSTLLSSLSLADQPDLLEASASRDSDSLFIVVNNPRKLLFRFQLFKGNVVMESGTAYQWIKKLAVTEHQRYYLSLQYVWAGSAKHLDYNFQTPKKTLDISVIHPTSVFPGQEVDFAINVKDALGKPVQNADITSFSYTRKFKSDPSIPLDQSEKVKNRKAFNSFHHNSLDEVSIFKKLDYDFWKSKLGLDSLLFYHFLYPAQGYFQTALPVNDSITQLAPFVVSKGDVQRIFYIYFNEDLKYFYAANESQPYSFTAKPGAAVNVTLRLQNHLLTLPVTPVKNKKLLFSVDLDHLPKGAVVQPLANLLSQAEADRLSSHFMWVNLSVDQNHAWLAQGQNYLLLHRDRGTQMAGPFLYGSVTFQSYFKTNFYFKPGMNYQFEPGLIDRSSYPYSFQQPLFQREVYPVFGARTLTQDQITDRWKFEDENAPILFKKYPDSEPATKQVGSLTMRNRAKVKQKEIAVLLFNLDQPNDYHIYPGGVRSFYNLLPGTYQVTQVFKDGAYSRSISFKIKPYGETLADLSKATILPPDSFSTETIKKIKSWSKTNAVVEPARQYDMQDLRERYYQQSHVNFTGGRWISGHITSAEDGSALPGVNIIVKGTTIGTVTDENGDYRIYVPFGCTLVASFIGLTTAERDVNSDTMDFKLKADVTQLQEIVVTGYGVQAKRDLTASVTTVSNVLSGRVAGVQITPGATDSVSIKIRGISALKEIEKPLVIMDGVVVAFDQIDKSSIGSIEILSPQQATALYGSRAAHGVILISTQKGVSAKELLKMKLPPLPEFVSIDENTAGSSLRKNFNDYAFWQPRLHTNAQGKVAFKATFPDDITAWNIYTIAVGNHKSGKTETTLRSFKPLAAQLILPSFLIEGDTTWAVGKISNYTNEKINVVTKTTIDQSTSSKEFSMTRSLVDSMNVIAVKDTIHLTYELKHKNYTDGEIRKLPVLKSGVREAVGTYVTLANDTTFTLHFNPALGKIKLYAQASFLNILEDEIQRLKIYSYDCNEQMASKLQAWLADKSIRNARNEKFAGDKSIQKLIKKLIANQAEDGGWSWWGKGTSSLWITLHVAHTLRWAERLSFPVQYNATKLNHYLLHQLNKPLDPVERLKVMIFLEEHGEHLFAKAEVDSLQKKKLLNTRFKMLLAQKLLQASGSQPDWEWINRQRKETLKGNYYWGESSTSLWDNEIENTLLVYSMLEKKNADDPMLVRLQNFLLERREQSWMNTYQSARIIETILPNLLKKKEFQKPELILNSQRIDQFPLEREITDSILTIAKKGSMPVYFGAYQYTFNTHPQPVTGDFVINTSWKKRDVNRAGKMQTVLIHLEVRKEADYVMITVPIPGGYSYESKSQSWKNGEVHREYDVHETRIYCEHLKPGRHEYEVNMVPRFKGSYTINPAKVEWMYYPVKFGRSEMKRIQVN